MEDAREVYAKNREQFYRRVRKSTQLVLGLVRSTMLHETPLSLLWAGVMLERVGQTARTLDMHPHTMELESAHQIVEVALWLSLLRASSGYEAFVKKYQGRISAQAVASFLVFDRTFPRSLRYCLGSARQDPDRHLAGRRGSRAGARTLRAARLPDEVGRQAGGDGHARPGSTICSPASSTR